MAFGLLTYGFIVNQLGWLMTPPRSELWAACLGACIPIGWYAVRTNKRNVLRVAVWSALGAGWGFAFGNFLQVMVNSVNFPMNGWNIMEYSIGFFGGLGMSYGTLTSTWPLLDEVSPARRKLPALVVLVIIPLLVWDQSFMVKQLKHILELGGDESLITVFQSIGIIAIVAIVLVIWPFLKKTTFEYATIRNIFILYLGTYTLLSFLLTGILIHPIEQYLYLVNAAVILILSARMQIAFGMKDERSVTWFATALFAVMALALLSLVVIGFNTKMMETVGRF